MAKDGQLTKFAKLSHCQAFPLYGMTAIPTSYDHMEEKLCDFNWPDLYSFILIVPKVHLLVHEPTASGARLLVDVNKFSFNSLLY